ncbi:type II toxin-antitoxin system VapC family toxin [Myxococcota bacterium]|nr:type II toxin-antitoxin system VapC family toxin [Myxococcota bacterium]
MAAVSPSERHHARAVALFESLPERVPFLVPAVFRVEVIAALARRGEAPELLDVVDALLRGPRFFSCAVDERLIETATEVARRAGLRAYDAIYVALALIRGAPLFTLDADLADRVATTFPTVQVRGGA